MTRRFESHGSNQELPLVGLFLMPKNFGHDRTGSKRVIKRAAKGTKKRVKKGNNWK